MLALARILRGPVEDALDVHRAQADDCRRVPALGRGPGRALGAARRRSGDDVAGAVPSRRDQGGGLRRVQGGYRGSRAAVPRLSRRHAVRIDAADDIRTGRIASFAALEPPAMRSKSTIPLSSSKSCLPAPPRSITAASSAAISRFRASSTISSSIRIGASPFTTSGAQGDAIETRVLTEGAVKLDPPGFEVAVEALFPLA